MTKNSGISDGGSGNSTEGSSGKNVVSLTTIDHRFPKAAIDYIDTLLAVQRKRFDLENLTTNPAHTEMPKRPNALHILAESDEFVGAGWSALGHRRDGTAFRWMGRIGSLLLPLNVSEPRPFKLSGCGFIKRRFLKDCTLWLDDMQIDYTLSRRGFNRWQMEGTLPVLPDRPYYILRLQSSGMARLAVGVDAFVSLAVNELRINC